MYLNQNQIISYGELTLSIMKWILSLTQLHKIGS